MSNPFKEIKMKSYKESSIVLLRYALSLLLIWFGLSQLFDPVSFIGYVPGVSPFPASTTVALNGLVDLILGLALIIGFKTRIASFLIFLHVLVIALTLGYNDIAARDIFIALSAFSIFLNGSDKISFDKYWLRRMNKD